MQNKDLLLYFESFLSIINKRNPTNIVGYERKVESMSNINISYKELKQLEKEAQEAQEKADAYIGAFDSKGKEKINEANSDDFGDGISNRNT